MIIFDHFDENDNVNVNRGYQAPIICEVLEISPGQLRWFKDNLDPIKKRVKFSGHITFTYFFFKVLVNRGVSVQLLKESNVDVDELFKRVANTTFKDLKKSILVFDYDEHTLDFYHKSSAHKFNAYRCLVLPLKEVVNDLALKLLEYDEHYEFQYPITKPVDLKLYKSKN